MPAALVVGVVAAAVLIAAVLIAVGNVHDPAPAVWTLAGAVAVRAR